MQPTPQEKLAASVFAAGLLHGFVRHEDVVRWADRRIEAADVPPPWLIDLSLSQRLHVLDVSGILKSVAAGTDPVATCEAIYALVPIMGRTFVDAEKMAARLYRTTRDCLEADWNRPLLSQVDHISDTFQLVRDGYTDLTEHDAIRRLHEFVGKHHNPELLRLLDPVAWSDDVGAAQDEPRSPLNYAPRPHGTSHRHLIFWAAYILGAWISYETFDLLTAPYPHFTDRVIGRLTQIGFAAHAVLVSMLYLLYLRRRHVNDQSALYGGLAFGLASLISQFLAPKLIGPYL